MKAKYSGRLLSLFIVLVSSSAQADLESDLKKCAKLATFEKLGCGREAKCVPLPAQVNLVRQCLGELNLKDAKCRVPAGALRCTVLNSDASFSDTKNCATEVVFFAKDSTGVYLDTYPGAEGKCEIRNAKFNLPVPMYKSIRKNGKWQPPVIATMYGFEKVVSAKDILVESIPMFEEFLPWKLSGGDAEICDGDVYSSVGYPVVEEATRKKDEAMRKAVGFENIKGKFPQRHYVGKKGPKTFLIASSFSLLKPAKACGVILPEGTVLVPGFRGGACDAAVDGALTVYGFPAELFPHVTTAEGTESISCAPKAQRSSNFSTLEIAANRRGGQIIIPELDWQDCKCLENMNQL